MSVTSSCAGIVLCGGKSSRMGTDKAGLTWYGQTLLQSAHSQLHQCSVSRTYSVGGDQADIRDKRPFHGPAVATLDALQSPKLAGVSFVLVLPVDMPALTPSILQHLVTRAFRYNSGCYYDNHMMPVVLKISAEFIARSRKHYAATSKLSLRTLIRLNQARTLSLDEELTPSFTNINHPAEWKCFLQSGLENAHP